MSRWSGSPPATAFARLGLTWTTGASAQAGGPWAAYSGSYEYDRVGNMRLKAEGGITHTMQYSDTAHVHAVSAVDGVAQSCDANGNMTVRAVDGVTYAQGWDHENRLVWVSTGGVTTTFTYDANGALVKKEDPAAGTTYHAGAHYEVLKESGEDPVVTKYYFHDGKRVAMGREGVLQYTLGGSRLFAPRRIAWDNEPGSERGWNGPPSDP